MLGGGFVVNPNVIAVWAWNIHHGCGAFPVKGVNSISKDKHCLFYAPNWNKSSVVTDPE